MTTTQTSTTNQDRAAAETTMVRTSAPLQIELHFELDVPGVTAFDFFVDRLPEWFGPIHKVSYDNSRSECGADEVGAHSARQCSFGNKVLVEEFMSFIPGKSFSYRADMARSTMKMPIRNHLGTTDFDESAGKTRVIWRQYFDAPPWPFGALVRWYMRERLMRPGLNALFAKTGGRFI